MKKLSKIYTIVIGSWNSYSLKVVESEKKWVRI